MVKLKTKPSIAGDLKLVERIEKLDLAGENKLLDADYIATRLRTSYSEYNRKPYKGFLSQVEKAIDQIINSISSDENDPDESGDEDNGMVEDNISKSKVVAKKIEQPEVITIRDGPSNLNDSLTSSYKQNQPAVATATAANNKRSRDTITISNEPITIDLPQQITTPTSSAANTPSPMTPKQTKKKAKRERHDPSVSSILTSKGTGTSNSLIPSVNFSNLGGIEGCLKEIREHIEYPICHPEIYRYLGVDPPRGILLHGPPGCGKTLLANAIAGELKVPLFAISAPEIASGVSGESEAKIRTLFMNAIAQAPCIIFIDEIDSIAPKRESASKDMERRIVSQLLTCMDSLNYSNNSSNNNSSNSSEENSMVDENSTIEENNNKTTNSSPKGHVVVIGATNRPESIDTALRIGGRFDKEICLGIPDSSSRQKILKVITSKMKLAPDFDYEEIATLTPGYVGADINLLVKESAVNSINRIFNISSSSQKDNNNNINNNCNGSLQEMIKSRIPLNTDQLHHLYIEMSDFKQAIKKVIPAAKREGFATIPNVSWDDVGALSGVREELTNSILRPIKYPKKYKSMGIDSPAGVLMYGPPGCGKTLLAKAIANECQANFISVKGPELLNKYVGESERAVRQVFQRAAASSPCVIFFDEFDALAPKRGGEGNHSTERVVNQLLTEMDGLEKRSEVFIIAATNRPDIIDAAMCRPGRLDKMVYVPLPSPEERVEILKTLTAKIPTDQDVDLSTIGLDKRTHAFSGADLSLLVKEAANRAISRGFDVPTDTKDHKDVVTMDDFLFALSKIKPSVSRKDELMYNKLNSDINKSRTDGQQKIKSIITPDLPQLPIDPLSTPPPTSIDPMQE
ncbi:hypothetical protein CYY_005831 [Polysphondylium violaceum]|uniref:AAA+ ATPase domain-containing protein n=1 Tax=Polysphondylium violaceum TaxID=133409 RepID=A0A8J4V6H6_9MYCE|nr:hypothetical protein CYY_005831 [Polysphondylium violaceum]